MESQLTPGAIEDVLSGNPVETPVFQVLTFKLIHLGNYGRYRMIVSDGKHKSGSTMLATQLNHYVDDELKVYSIFRVDRYVCNTVHENKKVMIVLDLTVLVPGEKVCHVIGSPVYFDSLSLGASNHPEAQSHPAINREVRNMNEAGPTKASPARLSGVPSGTHPIASLTPYQNKWTICARVTNKSNIRTWANSRGQGKLFSMDLLDLSGEIRATAFNEQCDKFYSMIDIDKVYYITQAQLKTANKQYSTLKNDYEMTFHQGTQMILCQENTNIPTMQFQFVSIDQLKNVPKDSTVDVIGVCRDAEDITSVIQKSTGRELKKRDIHIVDESGNEIRLTLWGVQAESFDGSLHPVMAFKGVKVSDFSGKSLSVLSSTAVQINPDIKESHKLRAWYENEGIHMQTVNLSNQRASGIVGGNLKTLGEAVLENLGCNDQSDFYTTKATTSLIRKENCLYPACPSDGCNKKVVELSSDTYRCEKCNKEYETFNWRLILNASLADGTDNVWATFFQDQAEIVLDCNSTNLGMMKENNENAFQAVFNEAAFREFLLVLRVKTETYNDERRLRTSVVSAQPLDCEEYNKTLVERIKNMADLD